MKILLAASRIPLGARVTKRTGEKVYVLRDRVRVFGNEGGEREILAHEGARFLISDTGDANAIPGDVELMWEPSQQELIDLLRSMVHDNK